ncbi:peptide-methionine (S)-S-oxide reductase MsrA [Psychromonas sp. MME2]|uniref:peptide-methionine (S)-S-oxide reductase MsrA n=1 Tax=unclassified Psychromonas TaxID=2614957 RepID=UPI00339CDD59
MAISTATFAGGCFWCIEAAFNSLNGVTKAISGYTGGITAHPNYKEVCSGKTKHAEAVQISFDDKIISYQELLTIFFALHDPTQLNRQGDDIGTQYRSTVFYESEEQKKLALEVINDLIQSQVFTDTIKTEVEELGVFYPAEVYHQGYFMNNPEQAYCAVVVSPKLNKFKEKYKAKLKK